MGSHRTKNGPAGSPRGQSRQAAFRGPLSARVASLLRSPTYLVDLRKNFLVVHGCWWRDGQSAANPNVRWGQQRWSRADPIRASGEAFLRKEVRVPSEGVCKSERALHVSMHVFGWGLLPVPASACGQAVPCGGARLVSRGSPHELHATHHHPRGQAALLSKPFGHQVCPEEREEVTKNAAARLSSDQKGGARALLAHF